MLSIKMRISALLVASLIVLSQVQAGFPPTLKLQGVVRDFSCLHPDMESPVSWNTEQRGLFLQQLTREPDARPISTPPQLRNDDSLTIVRSKMANAQATTTRFALSNFGQYFHEEYFLDVPGVNIALPIELSLDLVDPNGIYRYKASDFFPINGEPGNRGFVRELLDTAPLNAQVNRVNNFWFTTEFRMNFFYRGGETFSFLGDDDLFVFINGQLTTCDLGSIHIARNCSVNLDNYGMLPNTTNQMLILHAERHYRGSSFELTTSIVPINQPPIATGSSIVLNENRAASFSLQGFDPDYNPNPKFMILTAPEHGSISKSLNTWFAYEDVITYTPESFYNGEDSFTYIMNDGQENSTAATVKLTITAVNNPPESIEGRFEMEVEQERQIELKATDVDTSAQDLRFYLTSTPKYGYVSMDSANAGVIKYQAVMPGVEVLTWKVTDGMFYVEGKTEITVTDPNGLIKTGPLNMNRAQTAGFIVGVIAGCSLLAAGIAYFTYHFIAAKRFQKQWESEFAQAPMVQNPLYKAARVEYFNPLFEAASQPDVSSSTNLASATTGAGASARTAPTSRKYQF